MSPRVVTVHKSRTGTGTIEVYSEGGHLTCTCGASDCLHIATAVVAASAEVQVVEDGTAYVVVGTFESASSNRFYTVKRRRSDGALSCNCKGWIFSAGRAGGRGCKHTREVE
jgi:hypothetical protein